MRRQVLAEQLKISVWDVAREQEKWSSIAKENQVSQPKHV